MVARVRCPNYRSAVAVTLVWAAGDTCPSCFTPLPTGKSRRGPLWDPQLLCGTGAPQRVVAEPGAGARAKHLAAMARSLGWADESAARGDYADALGWVETVEALGEGGAQFTGEDEQAAVVLAEFAGVAVENARRYGGAKRQRDELKRTVATLEATTEVTRAVGGQTDAGKARSLQRRSCDGNRDIPLDRKGE